MSKTRPLSILIYKAERVRGGRGHVTIARMIFQIRFSKLSKSYNGPLEPLLDQRPAAARWLGLGPFDRQVTGMM